MDAERWQRIRHIFDEALALDHEHASAFLRETCAGDAALRGEVDALLVAHRAAGDFIEEGAVNAVNDVFDVLRGTQVSLPPGARVGPYLLVRELGRGGMGVVYLATRSDESFQQRVAIKLIRRGLDTEDILRRFLSERQILASLNHPNIAQLFDGGTTDDGRPYFVMEYVEGLPLLAYCDERQLSTRERLGLFRKTCAAVQHAHQHLIIHRDLKPSNILMTHDGEVKLLDFGVAKLLTPERTDLGLTGTLDRHAMTPEYASPEQVRGQRVTTATDIYSLGVVLFELLTGARPYVLRDTSPQALSQAICDAAPSKPSEAISKRLAIARGTGPVDTATITTIQRPAQIVKALKGDLDNIVLKALRKEPAHRYHSVEQLSEDIERHLGGQPVMARPATFRYRTAKFIGRNRIGVAAAVLVLLSLLGGIITTTWQARQARLEKANAESINTVLEELLNYTNPLLSPTKNQDRETTMSDVLDEAARRVESAEFSVQPEVRAALKRIIGRSYFYQGRRELGRKHLSEYVSLQAQVYGRDHPRTLDAFQVQATLLFNNGSLNEAEAIYRRILPLMRAEQRKGSIKAETLVEALSNFGYLRRTQGDSREAEALFRETFALDAQVPEASQFLIGLNRSTLASTLADQGRFGEALQAARDAVAEYQRRGLAHNLAHGFALTILGGFLTDEGKYGEADGVLREAEGLFRKRLTPTHLWLGDNLRNQAISFYRQDRLPEALSKASATLEIYRTSFGSQYDHYPTALIVQGLVLARTGQPDEGEKILREAVKIRTESLPSGHYWIGIANSALGEGLTLRDKFAEAEPLLVTSYTALRVSHGEKHRYTIDAVARVVRLYEKWNKPDLASKYRTMFPAG